MRALIYLLAIGTATLMGCAGNPTSTAADALSFYIVSDTKIEGGRFIDTPDEPRLGYIPATPDLVITKLEAVSRDKYELSSDTVDAAGRRKAGPWREHTGLRLTMYAVDAKRFSEFTKRAVGKQTLVMLGDSPLSASRMPAPITTRRVLVTIGEDADIDEIEHALQKLVK